MIFKLFKHNQTGVFVKLCLFVPVFLNCDFLHVIQKYFCFKSKHVVCCTNCFTINLFVVAFLHSSHSFFIKLGFLVSVMITSSCR